MSTRSVVEVKSTTHSSGSPPDIGWKIWSADIIRSAAWPVALVVCAIVLRKQIGKLLPRVSAFEGMGVKLTFDKQLEEAAEAASEVQEAQPDITISNPALDEFPSSVAVILESWSGVERALRLLAEQKQLSMERGSSALHLTRKLKGMNVLDANDVQLLDNLRHLRNLAAHEPRQTRDLPASQLRSYQTMASIAESRLDLLRLKDRN